MKQFVGAGRPPSGLTEAGVKVVEATSALAPVAADVHADQASRVLGIGFLGDAFCGFG